MIAWSYKYMIAWLLHNMIGEALSIDIKTFNNHIISIYKKHVNSKPAAILKIIHKKPV